MNYAFDIETPANTTKISPLTTTLKLTHGVIHSWNIFFPAGHWGECRFRIDKGSEPVLPINSEGFLSGDNSTYPPDDFIYLRTPPYDLIVTSWNVDTLYAHTVYIKIGLKPLWMFSPYAPELAQMLEDEALGRVL